MLETMLDKIPTEMKYVLIMAAIVLFQYILKRFAPQPIEQAPVPDEQPPEEEMQTQETSADAEQGYAIDAGHFGRNRAGRASASHATRRFSRKSLMGSRRETQDAVVIATILGPCRAFEAHDSR